MKANTCPYCGSIPAVPALRKMLLGPTHSTYCRSCGRMVGVPYGPSMIVGAIGMGIGFGATAAARNHGVIWQTRLVGAIVLVALILFSHRKFVRLIPR